LYDEPQRLTDLLRITAAGRIIDGAAALARAADLIEGLN
jgi:hypothetical protein